MILTGFVAQSDFQAQTAIDATGGFIKTANYSASYAVGEIQTITLKSGLPVQYATSGVIQPDPVVLTLTDDPLKSSFKLYPNPVKDILKIEYDAIASIRYKIYDLHGWILSDGLLLNRELKLGALMPGVYIVEFIGKFKGSPLFYLITKI